MNNFTDLLHQGFRITVGAATAFVETLQNPQKREETLTELQIELNQRSQEWAEKGEETELAARQVVEDLLAQRRDSSPDTTRPASSTTTVTNTAVQLELQELTEEIIALRTELEQLRQAKD
ncbi:MAG: hypothetical protein ACFB4I_21205 [Cyanophyceae cyanobacterium]